MNARDAAYVSLHLKRIGLVDVRRVNYKNGWRVFAKDPISGYTIHHDEREAAEERIRAHDMVMSGDA